jgi:hypothetical protein
MAEGDIFTPCLCSYLAKIKPNLRISKIFKKWEDLLSEASIQNLAQSNYIGNATGGRKNCMIGSKMKDQTKSQKKINASYKGKTLL